MNLESWFNKIINDKKTTYLSILFSVLGVILIRIFLENYSSPTGNSLFTSGYTTFLHYPLFYISIFLSLTILLTKFSKYTGIQLLKLSSFFFPIIWLPPLFDLLVTLGNGWKQSYIFHPAYELIYDLFSFFGLFYKQGISMGIRTEVLFILIGIGIFVYHQTKNTKKTLLALVGAYLIFYLYFCLPSLIALFFVKANSTLEITAWFKNLFASSWLSQIHSLIHLPIDPQELFDQEFNILMSRIFWLVILIQTLYLLAKSFPRAFAAWKNNLRWERIIYYFLISMLGMFIAKEVNWFNHLKNLADITALIIFVIVQALNFWLTVGINDKEDEEIDAISNQDRPLVTKSLTWQDQKTIDFITLLFIISGALLFNYLVFILILLFQMVYYLYAARPYRLKKYFGLSVFIIGLNALLTALAGFYLVSPSPEWTAFPTRIIWLILICFTLIASIKDIKDYDGDKAGGIKTIVTKFGLERGKKITGILTFAATLILALQLTNWFLSLISIIFGLIFYYLITKKNYQEKYLFYFGLVYLTIIILAIKFII